MQMDDVMKRRLVGAAILLAGLIIVSLLFFRGGQEPATLSEEPSDLADIRTYAIDVPKVPEDAPQKILAEGHPIGTLLPGDEPPAVTKPANAEPKKSTPPKKTKPVEDKPAMQIPDTGWSVQVGSFASRSNAETLSQKLKTKGYSAFIFRNSKENPPLFRVRVGPYDDEGMANDTAQRLRQELSLDVKVISNG